MKKIFYLLTVVFAIAICLPAGAQQTTDAKKTNFVKFKPPKLTSSIGILKDSSSAPVDQAAAVIAQPIKVTDAKAGAYTIQSYQFLYRRRIVTEDEMGNPVPSSSIVSQQFYNGNPLPEIWVKTIREDLKKNEEIYFFDIMVKDAQGRLMQAPDVKIMIK